MAEIRRRKFAIPLDSLRRTIGLPDDVTVTHVATAAIDGVVSAVVFVEHPSFDVVPEGSTVPTVRPAFIAGQGEVPVLLHWGAPGRPQGIDR